MDILTDEQFLLQLGSSAAYAMTTSFAGDRQAYYDGTYRASNEDMVAGEQLRTWLVDSSGTPATSFFKDGGAIGTSAYAGTATISASQQLGKHSGLGAVCQCEIKAIALYNKTLTAVQRANVDAAVAQYASITLP